MSEGVGERSHRAQVPLHRRQRLPGDRAAPDLQAHLQGAHRRERLGRERRHAAREEVRVEDERTDCAARGRARHAVHQEAGRALQHIRLAVQEELQVDRGGHRQRHESARAGHEQDRQPPGHVTPHLSAVLARRARGDRHAASARAQRVRRGRDHVRGAQGGRRER